MHIPNEEGNRSAGTQTPTADKGIECIVAAWTNLQRGCSVAKVPQSHDHTHTGLQP